MLVQELLCLILLILMVIGYHIGQKRASRIVNGRIHQLHSLPSFHGIYVLLWIGLPSLSLLVMWVLINDWIILEIVLSQLPTRIIDVSSSDLVLVKIEIITLAQELSPFPMVDSDPAIVEATRYYNTLKAIGNGAIVIVSLSVAIVGMRYGSDHISITFRARNYVEKVLNIFLILCACVAILTTIGIILSLLFEAMRFFSHVSIIDFLLGTHWSPQISLRTDQVGSSGHFGALPLFVGTLMITFIAMVVAIPIGLMSAIYMSEYALSYQRAVFKPVLEILAGIPTVVYGFFAALTVAPFIRTLFAGLGFTASSESALASGLVLGIMIIPFISSLCDDVLNALPQSFRDGAYSLGATRSEMIRQILLPAALPGICAAVLLGVSRAIGETMIVTMAAGLMARLTANPLDAVTTVTAQIATLLVGDQEFDNPKTLSAFGLGLVLFVVTLLLNYLSFWVIGKYRQKYE